MKTIDVSQFGEAKELSHFTTRLPGLSYRAYASGYLVVCMNGVPTRVIGSRRPDGYVRVALSGKMFFAHRLVAEAFIPNPDNLAEVDHIDGNRSNNAVQNLRWVSRSANMAKAFERRGNWLLDYVGKTNLKAVWQVDPATFKVCRWESARSAASHLGNFRKAANICKAIQTGRSAYGFFWSKADEITEEQAVERVKRFLEARQDAQENSFLAKFPPAAVESET